MIVFFKRLFNVCKCSNKNDSTNPIREENKQCDKCNKRTCHTITSSFENRNKEHICKCCNHLYIEEN